MEQITISWTVLAITFFSGGMWAAIFINMIIDMVIEWREIRERKKL